MATAAQLQRVLDAYNLTFGAVISSTGNVVSRGSDASKLDDTGLVSALLGPRGSAEETYNSFQGDNVVLSRMWTQGEEVAFVDRVGRCVSPDFELKKRVTRMQSKHRGTENHRGLKQRTIS